MTPALHLPRRATRVTAAAALVGLTVAGCSTVSLKHEADSARASLSSARSASFTLHVSDPRGELTKHSTDPKSAKIARDAAVTVTIDPAGDGTLGAAATARPKISDPIAALKASGAWELAYRNAGHDVLSLRLVDGVLYLRIDPAQYQVLAGKPLPLDELTGGGVIPGVGPSVAGIKAGKWLSLDLPAVYAKAKQSGLLPAAGRVGGAGHALDPRKVQGLGRAMIGAVQAHTSYTSTRADGATTLAFKVDARAALTAVVDVLGDPTYADLLGLTGTPAATSLADAKAALAKIPAGNVTGTVTMSKGHFRQVALNLASLAALSRDATAKDIKTARLIVDINDTAPALRAPAADRVVQVDALADALLTMLGSSAAGGGAAPLMIN